ncbi:VanZ family protein [Agromyces sp. Marseille-Q5079]|uniref:VanZ family protein n=1 Tax=Agromyces sp. Marseille-Q5079 TaxID=3439059 RepID=UPI003D9CBA34
MDTNRMPRRRVSAARIGLVVYLVLLGLIVFLPAPDSGGVSGILGWMAHLVGRLGVPVYEAYVVLEFLANIVLFVPFGVLVPVVFPGLRPWMVVALGLLTSAGIELVQFVLPTRFPTVSDVVANTLGALIGCLWVAAVSRRAVRARAERDLVRSPI